LLNRLRLAPATRSWRSGHALLVRDLPTARPWLVLHRRSLAGPRDGYLLCDKVENARELQEVVAQTTPRAKQNLIARLAQIIRRFHEAGLSHRDLKAANILWSEQPNGFSDGDGTLQFIDLVGVRCSVRVPPSVRARDLCRLNVSFLDGRHVSRTDKLRFLRTYLHWTSKRPGNWKEWWKKIAAASQEKIEKNRRSGRPVS
jgi:tRNA A-37 threonylcarbamoyl transferase component Bud32